MRQNNYIKNICRAVTSIFIYFFGQLHALDLFSALKINPDIINPHIKIIYMIIVEVAIISSILLINHETIENNFKDILKNHKVYFSKCIKYWLISIIVMITSNFIIMLAFGNGLAGNEESIRSLLKTYPVYVYVSSVIFAPIVEELIFRQSFRNIFPNKYLFIIISSLIFGGLHIIGNINSIADILYLIPYCAPGVAFAYMLIKTKNIFVSMGFHFMHNGILVSLQILLAIIG